MFNSHRWEDRYGAINGSIMLLTTFPENQRLIDFSIHLIQKQFEILCKDEEYRVRQQLALIAKEILEVILDKRSEHFHDMYKRILENFQRCFQQSDSIMKQSDIHTEDGGIRDIQQLKAVNEIEKFLETDLNIVKHLIEANANFLTEINIQELIEILQQCNQHKNRHLREINQSVINTILLMIASSKQLNEELEKSIIITFGQMIACGLADNWSQVRYAASIAARTLYGKIQNNPEMRKELDQLLIPRICFNRHYMADGVKLLNQEAWKQIQGEQGRQSLCDLAPQVTEFYISQLQSENYQVREAACHCATEIFTKIASDFNKEPYRVYAARFVDQLLKNIKDPHWESRVQSSLTLSHIIGVYPDEVKENSDIIFNKWFKHLSDNIATVRESCAIGIVNSVKNGYQSILEPMIKEYLKLNLMKAKEQLPEVDFQSSIPKDVKFELPEKVPQKQQEESKGASSPRRPESPRMQVKMDENFDFGFQRNPELWEYTDGCICLIRELSNSPLKNEVVKYLHLLPELGLLDQFQSSPLLKENLFLSMIEIVKNLGKKGFRPHIELYLDPAFRTARDIKYNCQYPAQSFIVELNHTYGEGIMKAIVESYDPRYLQDLEDIKHKDRITHSQQHFPPGFPGGIPSGGPVRFPPPQFRQ